MNSLKTTVLMAALIGLAVFIGSFWGRQGMILAFVLAAGMTLLTYWFSDKIVLAMHRAQEVDERTAPELVGLVRELTRRANLPMPRVYVIPDPSPNAFATGRDPHHAAVAVTEGILRLLSYDELRGVIGHELAHIRNRDILISTLAATIAGAITLLARMAYWGALFGGLGRDDDEGGGAASLVSGLFMIILAPIAAALIQLAISRSREYKADEEGARITGRPRDLASALRRLHEAIQIRPMRPGSEVMAHLYIEHPFAAGFSLFSTHPPVEARIARLERQARGQ